MIDFPAEITAGQTVRVESVYVPEFPPNDGWTLRLHVRGGGAAQTIDAVADDVAWTFVVPAATTDTWVSRVWWQVIASKAGESYPVDNGEITVSPSLASKDGTFDGSTHAQRTLAAIEAVIEKRATTDQLSHKIGDRELQRVPIADLLALRRFYKAEVLAQKLRRKNDGAFRQIQVRF